MGRHTREEQEGRFVRTRVAEGQQSREIRGCRSDWNGISGDRPLHPGHSISVKPALHRDSLCHIKASPDLAGRKAKEPPAGSFRATHTSHIWTHWSPPPSIPNVSPRGAQSWLFPVRRFNPPAVSLWCVFGQRIGCTDKPSLTFNEAHSDELASESHRLLLSWGLNKVLMRTFAPFVPKAQIFFNCFPDWK